MKKLLYLLLLLSSAVTQAQTLYIPNNPDSIKVPVNVNNTVRTVYVTDLTKNKVDKTKALQDSITLRNLINSKADTGAVVGNGREVQLQKSATHIQWRYAGEATWNNLVALSEITGAQGLQGNTGSVGSSGTNGREVQIQNSGTFIQWRYVGDATWNNIVSIATITGPQGIQGIQGIQGNPGAAGQGVPTGGTTGQVLAKSSNSDYATEWVTNSGGGGGINGKTILNGTTAPANGTGTDGDFYINTATNFIYGPKASGVWPAGVSLVGPQGLQGTTGSTGAAGKGISTVAKTGTVGLVDTYRITYTDASTQDYTVTNGATGAQGPAGSDATVTQSAVLNAIGNGTTISEDFLPEVVFTDSYFQDSSGAVILKDASITEAKLASAVVTKLNTVATPGTNGINGWTPVLSIVSDGERRVQQVSDWTGGEGTKPATGKYVGATGFETLIANGVDIRGAQGSTGATGAAGASGGDAFIQSVNALGFNLKLQTLGTKFTDITVNTNLGDGQVRLMALDYLNETKVVDNLTVYLVTSGVYTGDAENSIALFKLSGTTLTQVTKSTNNAALWSGTGQSFLTVPVTQYTAEPGQYFIGCLYNHNGQTTAPAVGTAPNVINAAAITPIKAYGLLSSKTAMPTSITLAEITASNNRVWGGIQ